MATQILTTGRPFLLQQSTDTRPSTQPNRQQNTTQNTAAQEVKNQPGSIFRGLFFALLFNIFLVLVLAAGWELWHVIR
jgi:hypothetical protein